MRKENVVVRSDKPHVWTPRAPKDDSGAHGKDCRERREPSPFRAQAHLLDEHDRDDREDHRENGDRLDDAERTEIVREALSSFALRVASGGGGTTLEERGKPDAKPGEDAEDNAGNSGTGDVALQEHDEHENHPVPGLRDGRTYEPE